MKIRILFIFLMIFLLPNIAYGKIVTCSNDGNTATIEIDKDKIEINKSANIKISSDTPYDVKYKTNSKDIILVSIDGEVSGINEGSATVEINVEFNESTTSVSTCKIDLPIEVVSNDSSLKSLKIEEYNLDEIFKSNKYDYNITVPYLIDRINIEAETNSKSATISGTGRKFLSEDSDTFDVVVTASDGTTSTYSISVTKNDPNNDSTLKSLIVEGYVLTPKFSKDILEYTLSVDKTVDEVNINAISSDENAKIDGIGKHKIATGENRFIINVTAENNSTTKYQILINKNNGNGKLDNLEIENYELNPKFNSEVYTYEVTVNSDVDSLKINATVKDENQIEIIGNEKFTDGKNDIIIRITGKDKSSTTYKVIVNRLSKIEQKEIEKNNSLLKILLIILIMSLLIMFTSIGIFIKNNFGGKKKVIIFKKKKIKQ